MQDQEQRFKELLKKHKEVSDKALLINDRITRAESELQRLNKAADEKFGEHDIEKLKSLRNQYAEDNQKALDKFEEDIAVVSNDISQKESMINQIQNK